MAPEQLEGKEADARTDIFAFGCVLYEMATGKKAFSASSQASLITAIMSSDPAPISSVQPMSPPALDRVVKTCLAKDPEDRWQNAADVEREIQWIGEGSAAGIAAPAAVVATPATARRAGLGPGRCGPRRRRGRVRRSAARPGGSAPPAPPGSASRTAVRCARAARRLSRRPPAAFHRRGRGRPRPTLGAVSGYLEGAAARRHGARAVPVLVSRRPHDRLLSGREAAANRRRRRRDPDDLRGGRIGFRRVLERERRDRVLRDLRRTAHAGFGRRRNSEARDRSRHEARRRGPPVSLVSAGRTAVYVRRAQRRPPQVIRRPRRSRRGALGRSHPLSGRFERGLGTAGLSALRPRRDALRAEIRRQARGPGGRPRRCDWEHPILDRRESGGSVGRRRPAGLWPLAARPPPRVGGSPGSRDGHARTRRRLRGRPDFTGGRSGRRVRSKSGGELESRRLGRRRRPRRRLPSLDRAVRRISSRLDSRRPEADLCVRPRRLLRSLCETRQRRA